MKHYFFINPNAGQGKGIDKLVEEIKVTAAELNLDCEIYMTKSVEDGMFQARKVAEELKGAPARFYACGGDGTNNEIINGGFGFENISFGCVPIGTGNDMVRSFPESGDFLSIRDQLLGHVENIDLIRFKGKVNGSETVGYCVNMVNIGLDCDIAAKTSELKTKPFIAGPMAYLLGVAIMFIRKKTIGLKLVAEGETLVDGDILLAALANGAYCGGGMNTSPQSALNDGIFDLNIVKDVTRRTFLNLFPKYKAGTHLQVPDIEKVIGIQRCSQISIIPKEPKFLMCIDGEILTAEGQIDFDILPNVLPFIVPAKKA
ncbi:MAG: hypothetical protein IKU44_05480 [Firmicutes bacterium]|nr:hypothetical protein [Bacillota bacterium]